MTLTKQKIAKYATLVERNCHGEVLEVIAKDLNETHYANLFASINRIHDLEGELNRDVHAVRERVRGEFKNHLKENLMQEEYEAIARYV